METVLLVVHLMLVAALIGLVLVQRTEGGALGIGGGGNFLQSRGSGNVLTRATTYLAAAFFATSIGLTVLAKIGDSQGSIIDTIPPAVDGVTTTPGTVLDLIRPQGATTPAATPEAVPAVPGGEVVPAPIVPEAVAPPASAAGAAPPLAVPGGEAAPPPAATPPAPLAVPE